MSEPQPREQGDQSEPKSQAERQRQVEALADAYLERLLAGETPDRQGFLAAYAELADLLGPRLELVELMHRVARGQRPAAEKSASLAPPAERALRVKCPHCGNGIQLVEPEAAEVTCSGCGSSFHVEPGATTSFHSVALPRSIGRFEVIEQLGRGAFGIVYKARDPQLQRLVAVKVPRAGSFATSEEEERFLREARAAAQLNHPGIVPVLEIAHERNLPYIVSAYIEGLTLADMLTARRPGFRETAELAAAVADALDFAHRSRIIHRDIKPSNLLLDDAGRPHITDFGLARRGEPEITVTLDGQILGTPAYMSPEQAAGDQQHVDARSDVYSLGVVLYELLTGELPFRGNQRMLLHQVIHDEPRPPRSLNDRVPRDLETICLKAMAKSPSRRYADAREMADDLRRFLNGEPIRARRVGRSEKLVRWARRNPLVAALMASVALLLLMATAVAISFALYQRQANRELADEKDKVERSQREAEVRAASAAVDLDLKHCEDGEIEYGVLRLARTLGSLPSHATELRQCAEMNLLAWAQAIRPLGPTFQYNGAETTWELSPDGLTVLTGGADGTARLWDAFTGEVRATLRGHRGRIASVAFSKNGRVAMTVGEDRTVRLWDASTGQIMGGTVEHSKKIEKAFLSPDGRRLLTICHSESPIPIWDGNRAAEALKNRAMATLWDSTTCKRVGVLVGHEGQLNDAVFSPDGQMILTGGADKTARLWSAENGRPLATLEGHAAVVRSVASNPDGSMAATLDTSGHVRWWDLKTFVQIGPPCKSTAIAVRDEMVFRFIQGEVAVLDGNTDMGMSPGWCFIQGLENGIQFPGLTLTNSKSDDDCVIDPEGRVYDRKTRKRRFAPAGRKFRVELARFALERRFIVLNVPDARSWIGDAGLIDLRTEKEIGNKGKAGNPRYVPSRRSFIAQIWPSPRYLPIPDAPLDTVLARLFAEVVTCHELDPAGPIQLLKETEWEERRRKLAGRLHENPAPFLIGQLAADRWYWLRRQADRARPSLGKPTPEEESKYLDRLIVVEPSWQNYHRRAQTQYFWLRRRVNAAQDLLEAGRLVGEGYWYGNNNPASRLANELILSPTNTPEEYQVGLQLAEALSGATPDNPNHRILVPIALYRLGRYAEALSHLEYWQREWEKSIISQVGQFLLLGQRAAHLDMRNTVDRDVWEAMGFLAMTHHRLGHGRRAQAAVTHLRTLGSSFGPMMANWDAHPEYTGLLREAETLIEGKPRPEK